MLWHKPDMYTQVQSIHRESDLTCCRKFLRETWRMESVCETEWANTSKINRADMKHVHWQWHLFLPERCKMGQRKADCNCSRQAVKPAGSPLLALKFRKGSEALWTGLHVRRGGGLQLVGVEGSVGVHRLLVRPHQRHLFLYLLLFHLHHRGSPLAANGWYIPVHSQDDKLEQHPQQAHEDLTAWRKNPHVFKDLTV